MKFSVIDSENAFQGPAFQIRRDTVDYSDGRQAKFDLLIHPGAVTIVPVDAEGNVFFVNQYRHSAGGMILELPAGTLGKDEAPLDCAYREVREEIGYSAAKMEQLGAFYTSPGYSTEYMYVFLATGLNHDPLPQDADEYIEVVKFPVEQVYAKLSAGEIHDGKTIAALALARGQLLED